MVAMVGRRDRGTVLGVWLPVACVAACVAALVPVAGLASTGDAGGGLASPVREAARAYMAKEYGLNAGEADELSAVKAAAGNTADALIDELGTRVLYVVIDSETGHLTITVTDAQAGRVVEAAGATALVGLPIRDLNVARDQAVGILAGYGIEGFTVAPNAEYDGLVVTVPTTVPSDTFRAVEEDLSKLGVPMSIEIAGVGHPGQY